jgi:SAM-dependent methyltransferase
VSSSRADFDHYFQQRARRFASFYRSETAARLLGRGPIFDRLRLTVDDIVRLQAQRVLDVGCGSGPLFAPLADRGIQVTGLDPAPAMVALARENAAGYPALIKVQQRRWEDLAEQDSYDVAVALGVFDYVDDAAGLLRRMGSAAPCVIASFPGPGLRLDLRKIRYGARGVHVYPYRADGFDQLAGMAGLRTGSIRPLGRAGHVVQFLRLPARRESFS